MRPAISVALCTLLVLLASSLSAQGDMPLQRLHDRMNVLHTSGGDIPLGLDPTGLALMQEACRSTGSTRCEENDFERELGAHKVSVREFFLDSTEISRESYHQCVRAGACAPVDERSCSQYGPDGWTTGLPMIAIDELDYRPRTCVTQAEAEAYCEWVGVRLPTEAEWASAAGVGTRPFPWPDEFSDFEANYRDVTGGLESVRQRRSSLEDGFVYHLAGNAYEWVSDGHACRFGEVCPESDQEVIRGGSYLSDPGSLRNTYRRFVSADTRSVDLGFRCAASYDSFSTWAYGVAKEAPSADVDPAHARIIGASGRSVVVFDLENGARQTIYEADGRIQSVAHAPSGALAFTARDRLGLVEHYLWRGGLPAPTRVFRIPAVEGERIDGVLTSGSGSFCLPVSSVPADDGPPSRALPGYDLALNGAVTRSTEPCEADSPTRLGACPSAELTTSIGDVSTVSLGSEDAPTVLFRLGDSADLDYLVAAGSCTSDHVIVHWSRSTPQRSESELRIVDRMGRVVMESRPAAFRSHQAWYQSTPAYWSPDRNVLLIAELGGWSAYDFERPPVRVSNGVATTNPTYLAPGEPFSWRGSVAPTAPARIGIAAHLHGAQIEQGGSAVDSDGNPWVTAPDDSSLHLFPLSSPPEEARCQTGLDFDSTAVWTFESQPDIALAWTVPPEFLYWDGCLKAWPALTEADTEDIEPSRAVSLNGAGEEDDDCWAAETLILEHDLLPRAGSETLQLRRTQLSLSDTSGTVISELSLEPWTVANYGGCTEWGELVRESDHSWRIVISDESEADGTGHDGEYWTRFDVRIDSTGLRVIGSEYFEDDEYDPEEVTGQVARDLVGWQRDPATEDSECHLAPSEPLADQEKYGLVDRYMGSLVRREYVLGANRLVAELIRLSSISEYVFWPNTLCGATTGNRSHRIRWTLERDTGRHGLVDALEQADVREGLVFRSTWD